MTRHHLIAVALLSLVLAGCASVRVGPPGPIKVGDQTITLSGQEGFDPNVVRRPDPHNPNVFLTDTYGIVIDQEPIRPTMVVGGRVYIGWALDSQQDYTFPDNTAIQFRPGDGNPLPSNFSCTVSTPKKKVIVCGYDKPGQPQQWKYLIRAADKLGTEISRLDPWVQQP
jgi:hypothetical protein